MTDEQKKKTEGIEKPMSPDELLFYRNVLSSKIIYDKNMS